MGEREYIRQISIPVFLAICIFATASWTGTQGIWAELPLMINQLPEGWNIASYLILTMQIANIGPLIFTIFKRFAPSKVPEWRVIYVLIVIGITSCLLLVLFWDKTTYVGGKKNSTALFILTFFVAFVGCTSSVVFLPYMAPFAPQYLTAYYIGIGLCGVFPGMIGLIQGVGKDPVCVNSTKTTPNGTEFFIVAVYDTPLFSIRIFLGIIFILMCFSGVAFTFLHFHPNFKRHRVSFLSTIQVTVTDSFPVLSDDSDNDHYSSYVKNGPIETINAEVVGESTALIPSEVQFSVSSRDSVVCLFLIFCLNLLMNGVLPSLQPFSCLPYGSLAFTLTIRLSILANPIACFFGLFFQVKSTVVFILLVVIGTVFSGYQIALASFSPEPPLAGKAMGIVLVVVTSVLLTAIFSYAQMNIASALSIRGGAKALLWCGGVAQIGCFTGAIISFILVNVVKLFKSATPCT